MASDESGGPMREPKARICGAEQHDPEGIDPPNVCVFPVGHAGPHEADRRRIAVANVPESAVQAALGAGYDAHNSLDMHAAIAAALTALMDDEPVRLEDAYRLQEVGVVPSEVLAAVLDRAAWP